MENLLTVENVAELLKLSPYTIREYAKVGKIPAVKFGRMWRFSPQAIKEWIEKEDYLIKSVFKVWEKKVTGCLDIENPEEAAAIDMFNSRFTELFWALPKEKRYVFMKLLKDIKSIVYFETGKSFSSGLKIGKQYNRTCKE
jgi:excisionase family DNA binding protein